MMKAMQKFMIVICMSLLLAACGMNQNDDENIEENHNLPMEERNNDEQMDEDSENIFDRDSDGNNNLPELETEDGN